MLPPDAPRKVYRSRIFEEGKKGKGVHWGQRKLLMNEIEMLVLHGRRAKVVVYAGSAPGIHIRFLSQLFPQHRFLLVDPRPFARDVQRHPKIELRQEYFTDAMASELRQGYVEKGVELLFISDIRTVNNDQRQAMVQWSCSQWHLCRWLD